jgi:uncharacterized protein
MADDKTGPKPGHFLPGGAGDAGADPDAPLSRPSAPKLSRKEPLKLSGPHPQQLEQETKAWSQTRGRRVAPPAHFELARRLTMPMVIGLSVLALFVVGGGVALTLKLMGSYDDLVQDPLTAPSARDTPSPGGSGKPGASGSPTVTVTAVPVPDALVVKENKLYSIGKLTPSKCKEPAWRPTSKAAVQKYASEMLRCLDKSWKPAIEKAGHQFRPVHPVFNADAQDCVGGEDDPDQATYCTTDETLYVPWERFVAKYPDNKISVRAGMAETIASVYGFHVQRMAGIGDAAESRGATAPNKAAELAETRRVHLQADCFGAMYIGANKKWHPWRGQLLEAWEYSTEHAGDDKGEERRYGSRKNVAMWNQRGFDHADPKYCNTFNAPAGQVS